MQNTTPKMIMTDAHNWTNGTDEVLILKCVNADGLSFSGNNKLHQHVDFRWPLDIGAQVEAPDWTVKNECGGGLHGWPWGFGIGDGKEPDWSGRWIVFGSQPEDVIGNLEGGQKCKARAGVIRFVGDWHAALQFILKGQMAFVAKVTSDAPENHATGDRSASSATGYQSASSATGEGSASSATGYRSASVVTGISGRARAGKFGCIALAWWNEKENRGEMRCREIGIGDGSDGKLKADTWYRLNPQTSEFEQE